MTTHSLKTWPEPFAALWDGRKTAEFRRDDRGYQEGDRLELSEYDPESGAFSGRSVQAVVSHVVRGGPHGMPEGYVMLSLRGMVRVSPAGELRGQAGGRVW
jgi:hypothetical protein